MSRTRRFLRTPFGSALLGGARRRRLRLDRDRRRLGRRRQTTASADRRAAALAAPVASHGSKATPNVVNEIYKRDGQGVAFIEADQPAAEKSRPSTRSAKPEGGGTATGSGFVIDTEGHILTNNHVVEGAEQDRGQARLLATSPTRPKVVGTDPATDVALLKVDVPADQLHPLALGDSSKVEVGDPVVAIGNPFGLDRTVTSGIVSALQRQIEAPNGFSISHVIQTDAAINPGNSGGPLIDADGRVIGINSQIETGGGGNGNVGIGFAIPINTAREVAEQIEKNGKVEHAYLGISGGTHHARPGQGAQPAGRQRRARQPKSVKGGPADKAGIEGGDTAGDDRRRRASRSAATSSPKLDGKKITEHGRSDQRRRRQEARRRDRSRPCCAAATKRPSR